MTGITKIRSILLLLFISIQVLLSQQPSVRMQQNKEQSAEDNNACFRCHALDKIHNDTLDIIQKKKNIVDTNRYYSSVHGSFRCIDCHSEDFSVYPHTVTVKDDVFPSCMDCHEGNKKTARFHFEEIAKAYDQSIHATVMKDDFSCWKCHDPHGYADIAEISDSVGLAKMIADHNDMCLKCHGNAEFFKASKDPQKGDVLMHHEWLPEQELHFRHVRCIDCHAAIPDSMRISHNILKKEQAVKSCIECHSVNSRLLATLYKYDSRNSNSAFGFFNPGILENSYVFGANRNYILNAMSIGIFGITIFVIIIHLFFRVILNKKKNG